jgi:hypothetical protein
MRTVGIILAVFMMVPAIITGCSKAAPSTTPLTAMEIISKSGENMQAVNSFHFLLDQTGGGTPITMGIEMTKAEGDIVRPDKMQATISGTAMGMSLEVKLVSSGGTMYMTNPLSGAWEVPPDQFKVFSIFDPATGLAAILKGMTAPGQLGEEQKGGTLCYHLKGSVASDALRPITGSAVAGVTIDVEVWIGEEDFLVRQIRLEGKITESEKDGIVRTLDLSGFNQEVNIQLPQ